MSPLPEEEFYLKFINHPNPTLRARALKAKYNLRIDSKAREDTYEQEVEDMYGDIPEEFVIKSTLDQ